MAIAWKGSSLMLVLSNTLLKLALVLAGRL